MCFFIMLTMVLTKGHRGFLSILTISSAVLANRSNIYVLGGGLRCAISASVFSVSCRSTLSLYATLSRFYGKTTNNVSLLENEMYRKGLIQLSAQGYIWFRSLRKVREKQVVKMTH